MEWNLVLLSTAVILFRDGIKEGIVYGLKGMTDSLMFIKVRVNETCLKLNFSDCTNEAKGSRNSFIEKWSSLVLNYEESLDSTPSTSHAPLAGNNYNQSEVEDATETPVFDSSETEVKEQYHGIYDVHIGNLIAPNNTRQCRVLDLEHVKDLITSFGSQAVSQVVVLIGMVKSNCDINQLKYKGNSQVETLGGNHTREALQNLLSRGLIDEETTVKCHLYGPLTRQTALMLGLQHNTLVEEKQKRLTFMDKVRLMRSLRPSTTTVKGTKDWKQSLVEIFKVSDSRRLTQSYSIHLRMASFRQDLYQLLESAAQLHSVHERFFRRLMKIKEETKIQKCLQCLVNEGVREFKTMVNVELGMRNSKKSREDSMEETDMIMDIETEEMEETATEENEAATEESEEATNEAPSLQEQYNSLLLEMKLVKIENAELKEEIARLKRRDESVTKKRKTDEDEHNEKQYQIDEHVEAFWQYEDGSSVWLPATVKKIYKSGEMLVQYEDGQCKVKKTWVKKFGSLL